MGIYALGDLIPQIHPDAFIHPDATVIGAVTIGAYVSVWPQAVLRADHGRIEIGERTSIQDGTVAHTTPQWPTIVGRRCVVGHNVHIEGCSIGDGCLIGSGSIVLNRAVVESGAAVAAAALVPEDIVVHTGQIGVGVPVRMRPAPDMPAWIDMVVESYVEMAKRYKTDLRRIH